MPLSGYLNHCNELQSVGAGPVVSVVPGQEEWNSGLLGMNLRRVAVRAHNLEFRFNECALSINAG